MTITLEIDHGGIDGRPNAALAEKLREKVRMAALVDGRHAAGWPHPECVRDLRLSIVAHRTERVGDATIALIRTELARWLCAGETAITVAPVLKSKSGPAKRIVLSVTAALIVERSAAAFANASDPSLVPRVDDHGNLPNVLRDGEVPAYLIAPVQKLDERGRIIATLPLTPDAEIVQVEAHDPLVCRIPECRPCNRVDDATLRPEITIPPGGGGRSNGVKREPKALTEIERSQLLGARMAMNG